MGLLKERFLKVIFGVFFIVIVFSCQNKKSGKNVGEKVVPDTLIPIEPILRYGIPIDSFHLVEGVIKSNEYLSEILNDNGVGMVTIDKLARKSKPIFDVRKIRSGQKYTVFQTADSLQEARYFVYENSPTEYFVYELFDTLKIYRGEKEVKVRQRIAQGVIETSLWNCMEDNGLSPVLSLDLSRIFAWTIDFFAIQKGDRFRIIYDELFVDSTKIGIGEIYAVQFDHYGDENYAFRYFQDNSYSYFDEKGVSLQKAFLKAPLDYYRISSRFSNSRLHPVLRIRRPHHGVDYAAPKGTPVMSIGDGTVIARAYQKNGGGNYVKIKHNSVYTTTYMHLSGFGKGISTGSRVKQSQIIGYVGATGLATGPHLDFRIAENGSYVDPLKVKAPPVEPVKEENLPKYMILKDSLINELQKIEWAGEELLVGN
ncbi:peptidoglycan DD-metalloendopeptidase family protein [Maribellus comscasis]|uniref:Peptidoglycan DD-metalloendopeptidase family protein n=1 Tax=Maribellus comscasis TaxID=2681766 RepID=A0A6I6JV89_9BACT|nr:peptidoglycan DD-metalloendopeptidase family protein [Maribellus comscasis]QGY45199.1 peptidoglycan DD-metalloendopeptidase family protein [Maribellus comscasis]